MEGVVELRERLAAVQEKLADEETRHAETKAQLESLREKCKSQQAEIQELERAGARQRTGIEDLNRKLNELKERLATQKANHNDQMDAINKELAAVRREQENDKKKSRAIRQRERSSFVAGQLATVFIERLGMKFLKGDWRKHRRSVANLDDLRNVMGNNASELDEYLATNVGVLDVEAIYDYLHSAKERRNASAHSMCLDPDHTDGGCDCDPTSDEVDAAIRSVTSDSQEKSIMSWVVTRTDNLKRELQHRRLLRTK
jgi:chromosome segregation ATPase